jgi:phage repressor protein C with HTH and peptisase S24 domain
MLSHGQIWTAIDTLASRYGLTTSGLARKAGLDPTTFNRSKRISPDGRLRWPSTESVAKVLDATGASLDEFLSLLSKRSESGASRLVPLIGLAQAGSGGFFDENGFPKGEGWDEVTFPEIEDEHLYALEVQGESMQPLYRAGDIIICSPDAAIRRGDRVVVRTLDGEVMAKELRRRTAKTIELGSLNPAHDDRVLKAADVVWIARIVWASQ